MIAPVARSKLQPRSRPEQAIDGPWLGTVNPVRREPTSVSSALKSHGFALFSAGMALLGVRDPLQSTQSDGVGRIGP